MAHEDTWHAASTCANGFPSPLRGGARGGGNPQGWRSHLHPTPNPSPSSCRRRVFDTTGGEFGWRRWLGPVPLSAVFAGLFPTSALAAGGGEVSPFVYQFMVFVIAIFVGYYVVWSVTPALHTPLMSVTNAISSVIVVGALLAVGVALVSEGSTLAKIFGFLALVMASVNIFGGFLVTQRMLGMYKKREPRK
jgi:H+-translocating NAD(P) transhydrogenase subunit alpha